MSKKIAILTYGTFCDIKLSLIVAQEFIKRNHQVDFLTNSVPDDLKIIDSRINYHINEANNYLNLSDPSLTEKGEKFTDIVRLAPFIAYINTKFKSQYGGIIEKADYVLVHYPALIFNPVLVKAKKLGIFYVAPGYPNLRIPYIFSPEISGYNPGGDKQYVSSIDMTIKMSLIGGTNDNLYKLIKKADIFTMWDPLIKDPPKSVKSIIKLSNILTTSVSFPKNTLQELLRAFNKKNGIETNRLTSSLKTFTGRNRLVYMSFGSFVAKITIIKQIINVLSNMGYKVVYHGKYQDFIEFEKNPNVFLYDKYIPHEWIIPHCYMIVTSGSYCMTSIANYYGVFLLHAPLLKEQLFWAKCYAYNTDSKFIDLSKAQYNEKEIEDVVESVTSITNLKLKIYTKRLQYSVKKINATKTLVDIISKKV